MSNDYDYYDTTYYDTYSTELGSMNATANSMYMGVIIVFLVVIVVKLISNYKIFKKAGKKGWASFVPVYNQIVSIEIAELPIWYIALYFVPFVDVYAVFKVSIETAHKFGKSTGFGILMVFFSVICYPILAFGKSQYKGNSSDNNIF